MDLANRIATYAYDTYLITVASKRNTIEMELNHVVNWAAKDNLHINTTTPVGLNRAKWSSSERGKPHLLHFQELKGSAIWSSCV